MDKKVYEFISKQTQDPIVEWKTCEITGEPFAIFQSDRDFLEKISPTFNGVKYQIPTPTLCPDLRHMRRMWFRNDRSLYHRKCDATGKNIVCMFAPGKPYKVYDRNYRRGDAWSGFDCGMDFDFTKTFTEQFDTLLKNVPLPWVVNSNSHNSEFVNQTGNMKNSYLMFSCMDSENCYYGHRVFNCVYCVDCSVVNDSQNCYECINGRKLYKCFFSQNVKDCSDCYFLFDCEGCKDCFGCRNLRNKQYCIWNREYSKEAYEKEIILLREQIKMYSWWEKLQKKFDDLISVNAKFRSMYLDNSEKTYGWFLYNCKKVFDCYEWGELENCKYGLMLHDSKYVQDGNNSTWAQWQYEVSTWGIQGYQVLFSLDAWPQNSYVMYSAYNPNCSHLFGCVGLKNQEYCIFNKQYNKKDYEELVAKILWHMQKTWERWEFFNPSISPFTYNESAAFEYFPLTEKQAKDRWFQRYADDKELQASNFLIPDNIDDVDDSILSQILPCSAGWKPFKIIKQELDFYHKYGLPIPRVSFDKRHVARFNKKPDKTLHLRTCDNCWIEMLSIYDKEVEFKVYCENCYNKEIYW